MADLMDVDTTPTIPDLPPLPDLPPSTTDPLILLRHALHPFIRLHLSRALGPDMVSVFAPSPTATLPVLLRFINDKWLGVFTDSALAPHRDDINNLSKMLLHGDDLASATAAHKVSRIAQQLLQLVGKSSLAARVSSPPTQPATDAKPPVTQGLHLISGCPPASGSLLPVVLDGANIAWRHGRNSRFSLRGAAEALHYFSTRGHPTVLFLPEARLARCDRDEERTVFDAVNALAGSDSLVTTPDHDYDDSYICHFARRHGAVVVSNDAFKDQVYQATAEGKQQADEWDNWFQACRLSFTFRSDLFIPNPSFNYQKAAVAVKQLALKE